MSTISKNTIAQRKCRARKHLAGYQRFDISIPPDLWVRLYPYLNRHNGKLYPGKAIVELLGELEFSDE